MGNNKVDDGGDQEAGKMSNNRIGDKMGNSGDSENVEVDNDRVDDGKD